MNQRHPGQRDDLQPVGSTTRAAARVLAATVAVRALAFAKVLLVARLLVPAEFGRFAMVAAVVGAIEVTTTAGIKDALVVKTESLELQRTAWTVSLIRAVLTAGLIVGLAPIAANLMGEPSVASLLRWMALVPALRAASSVAPYLAQRRMDLRPQTTLLVAGQTVDAITSVVVTAVTATAAGLVAGAIAGAATYAGGSYLVRGFAPRLQLGRTQVAGLLSFGRWRFLSGVLVFLSTQGDDLVVGRVAGTGPLGIYRMAYRIGNLPTTEVSGALHHAMFPALARSLRSGTASLARVYKRYVGLVAFVGFPLTAMLLGCAEPLVLGLLGDDWRGAVLPLQVLLAGGLVRALLATGGQLFLAADRPALDTAMQVIRTAVLFGGLGLLLPPFGVSGAAWASLLSTVATIPVWVVGLRTLDISIKSVTAPVLRSAAGAVVIAAATFMAASWAPGGALAVLLTGIVAGATVSLAIFVTVERPRLADLRSLRRSLQSSPPTPTPTPIDAS